MKKLAALIFLTSLLGCNDATTSSAQGDQPVSLNEISTPVNEKRNEQPTKKETNMAKHQKHEIAITVPDSTWSVEIKDVLETETETAIIVKLNQAEGMMGMQVISEVITAVECETDKPVKVYVYGKIWGWKNTEDYEFVDAGFDLSGKPIAYEVVEPSRKGGAKRQVIGTPLEE